jgi:hypothetical protein
MVGLRTWWWKGDEGVSEASHARAQLSAARWRPGLDKAAAARRVTCASRSAAAPAAARPHLAFFPLPPPLFDSSNLAAHTSALHASHRSSVPTLGALKQCSGASARSGSRRATD